MTGAPCEFLHPYWDVRLVRFFLRVPAVPWCRNKHLIRVALRGLAPEAVRLRPKAPLAGLPYLERIRRSGYPELPSCPEIRRYVDKIPVQTGRNREEIDGDLRILGLQYWLLGL
jgi:hypothetical protein